MMRWLSVAALVLSASASPAQEAPVVRVDVSPESVAVGESVEVRITILVPTWFPEAPSYPDFELANTITRLPPDGSNPTSERIGGKLWSGIVRRYRMYPLVGATYRIADASIDVTWADPGADPFEASIAVPEIVFRGTVPAGAEQLDPYVAGSGLALDLDVENVAPDLEAGDAVVLTWKATLEGLPAIFIPPLAPPLEFEGASVYADQPVVDEGPPGTRTEKVTLVFEAGGNFEIPAVSIDYWNTEAGSVDTATANGTSITVAGPPPAVEEDPVADDPVDGWRLFLLAALVTVLVTAAVKLVPVLRERSREAETARRAGEQWAFAQAEKALRTGDALHSYEDLLLWVDRLRPPVSLREFTRTYGDNDLVHAVDALARSQFDEGEPPDLDELRRRLAASRKRALESSEQARAGALPPLNPL